MKSSASTILLTAATLLGQGAMQSVGFAATVPEIVMQRGHSNFVEAISLSPDGAYVLTGGEDATARIWDTETGRMLRILSGHGREVNGVAFSSDGSLAATSSRDGTAIVWDLRSGNAVRVFADDVVDPGCAEVANTVAFSPNGELVAAAFDCRVYVWDLRSAQPLKVIVQRGVQALAFGPDQRVLATGTWSGDNEVAVWSLDSGYKLYTLRGHTLGIASLSFRADGAVLASGSDDGTLRLWSLGTGSELARRTFQIPNSRLTPTVHGMFSADGQWLVIAGSHDILLCSAESPQSCEVLASLQGSVSSLAFSRNGRAVATADSFSYNSFSVWDVASRELKIGLDQRSQVAPIRAVAMSRDGDWIATAAQADEGRIEIWETESGMPLRTLYPDSNSVESLAFSPTGPWLAGGSSVGSQRQIFQPGQVRGNVSFWDVVTGRYLGQITDLPHAVRSLAFNGSGERLLTASGGNVLHLWAVENFEQLWSLRPVEVAAPHMLAAVVGYSRDGNWMYAGGQVMPIQIWETREGTKHMPFGDRVRATTLALDVSPDGSLAARADGNDIEVWETNGSTVVARLSGHSDFVSVLKFSPDGAYLVSGSVDNTIAIWRMSSRALHRQLVAHEDRVVSLTFMPDGDRMFSGSGDGTTRLWDVASGELLATLVTFEGGDWLVAAPDGLFDGTPGGWRKVQWRFGGDTFDIAPTEIFFNEFFHPGLLAEVVAGEAPRAPSNIADIDRRQPMLSLRLRDDVDRTSVQRRWVTLELEIAQAPPAPGQLQGSGARDVRLFRNGSLIERWRGDALNGRPSTRLEARVPMVAGENEFTAYAFNSDNVKSADASIELVGDRSLQRPTVLRVVAVGINQYADARNNLRYAVADARAFAAEVQAQVQAVGRYDRVEVIPLLNEAATKAGFLDVLERLADETSGSQPEDGLVIFFAGHGDSDGDRFYFIPHEFRVGNSVTGRATSGYQSALQSQAISDQEIEVALEGLFAEKLLLVVDACRSGQVLETEERRRGPMNSKGLAQLAYEKGMNIITASQAYQLAVEPTQLEHGLLTYALVEEGLKTEAADRQPPDGELWGREWLDYAVDRVPEIYLELLGARTSLDRGIEVVSEPETLQRMQETTVQRPRVFYRREPETTPLVLMRR